jgi:hypothetical protein
MRAGWVIRLVSWVAIRWPGAFIATVCLIQGPKILRNRVMWGIFGEAWNSGCWLCGGTGKAFGRPLTVKPDGSLSAGDPIEENCGICNGFHD